MNDIPYSVKMAVAMMSGNREMVDKVVVDCFDSMTHKLTSVAREYDQSDLPFVVATMRITASALSSLLDDSGRSLVENLVSHTACITVDAEELRRQAAEEDEDGMDKKR